MRGKITYPRRGQGPLTPTVDLERADTLFLCKSLTPDTILSPNPSPSREPIVTVFSFWQRTPPNPQQGENERSMLGLRAGYDKLPLSSKFLLPLLGVFFSMGFLGTLGVGYFFTHRLEEHLREETQELSELVLHDLEQKRQLLDLKARATADRADIAEAVASGKQAELLQTLLPIQTGLELDYLKVVNETGAVLAELRQGETTQATLDDGQILHAASRGLILSDLLVPEEPDAPILVSLLSVKSDWEILGGLILGSTLDKELLEALHHSSNRHLAIVHDSQVLVSTLPAAKRTPWQPPKAGAPPQRVTVERSSYMTYSLPFTGATVEIEVVLLNPTAAVDRSRDRLWLFLGIWCAIAGMLVAAIGFWVTQSIVRRIGDLTRTTQKLADGDLSARIPVEGGDEVSDLAHRFNTMAEQLAARDAKIHAQMLELEQTLNKLQQMPHLIQTEKMSGLGQMVAGVAHEINNPVSFIYGNIPHAKEYIQDLLGLLDLYRQHYPHPPQEIEEEAEAIELDFLIEDLTKLLGSMRDGADRIRTIVASLRNFSRMDEAQMKEVNLHDGIDSTLAILGHRLKAQGDRSPIQVVKHYGELPLVECYPGELNQVVMNLLVNAIDALEERDSHLTQMETEPSTILIRTEILDRQWVTIRVTDNGLGMSEQTRSKLFDPFFTTKPIGEGTGLGLSIGYQIIVDKHGGKLSCNSTPGRGAEFIVQIPIRQTGGEGELTRVGF